MKSRPIVIPSDIKYIRRVSADIVNLLKSGNADESAIFDIRLAAEEAIKNAIIHGNRNKKNLKVSISYSLEGDKFTLEVKDEGKGFNPEGIPDPTLAENIFNASGRGIFLIRKLMDKVEYNSGGSRIFMVKFLKDK